MSANKNVNCLDHKPERAVALCENCARGMCDLCFEFRTNGKPSCARCAYERSTKRSRRVSLAVSFFLMVSAASFFFLRRFHASIEVILGIVIGVVITAVVAVLIGRSGGEEVAVERRDREVDVEEPIAVTVPHAPYRVSARRVLLAASPRLSAKATALVMLGSFAAAAVLVPAGLKFPRWIEAELVLVLWWIVVAVVTTTLLYRGYRLRDDFVYFAPWERPSAKRDGSTGTIKNDTASSWGSASGCDVSGGLDGEGALVLLVFAIAAAALFGAAWVMVELAMPVLFLLMYALFMRAIGRVANDRHECKGAVGRALGWGTFWATVYVAPLVVVTWLVHVVRW